MCNGADVRDILLTGGRLICSFIYRSYAGRVYGLKRDKGTTSCKLRFSWFDLLNSVCGYVGIDDESVRVYVVGIG